VTLLAGMSQHFASLGLVSGQRLPLSRSFSCRRTAPNHHQSVHTIVVSVSVASSRRVSVLPASSQLALLPAHLEAPLIGLATKEDQP